MVKFLVIGLLVQEYVLSAASPILVSGFLNIFTLFFMWPLFSYL